MSRVVLLPHSASSVGVARRRLETELSDAWIAESAVDDAVLVTSELLSNALRHAAPLPQPFPPDCVRLSWNLNASAPGEEGWVEVAVSGGGSATLPRVGSPSTSSPSGRGLGIVQQLAAKWGTEVDDATTTVWAVLNAPQRRRHGATAPPSHHHRTKRGPVAATGRNGAVVPPIATS